MSIYGKKMKSVGSIHNPYESNVTKVPKTNNKQ